MQIKKSGMHPDFFIFTILSCAGTDQKWQPEKDCRVAGGTSGQF